MPIRDNLLADYRSLVEQYRAEADPLERGRLKEKIQQARANLTMSKRMERAGVPIEDVLAPIAKKDEEESVLTKIGNTLDYAGNAVRKNVIAPMLGVDTKGKEHVYGTDILSGMGWNPTSGGGRVARGIVGFAGEMATDPLTYLSLGTGGAMKVGGKALSKPGRKAFAEIAKTLQHAGSTPEKVFADASADFIARHGANAAMFDRGGVKLAGQRIPLVSDALEATGRGIKNQWADLEKLANPMNQPISPDLMTDLPKSLKTRFAEKVVPAVNALGEAVSTKWGKSEEYLNKRRVFNSAENQSKVSAIKIVKEVFGDLGQKSLRKITLYLDKPEKYASTYQKLYGPLTDAEQAAAGQMAQLFKYTGDEMVKEGVMEGMLENYVTHSLGKNIPGRSGGIVGGGIPTSPGGVAKARATMEVDGKTVQRFETLGDLFDAYPELRNTAELDAKKLLANYMYNADRAITGKKFLKDIEATFSVKDAPFAQALKQDLVDYGNGRGTVIKNIPIRIARDLERMDKFNRGATTIIGKIYDRGLSLFKKGVTVPWPAFHIRNYVSNTMQNFLDLGMEGIHPQSHYEALMLKNGKAGTLNADNGIKYSYDEIRQLAHKYGVLKGESWGMGPLDKAIDTGKKWSESNVNPMNVGRKAGGFVEDQGRVINFMANLRRGFSPEQAAKHTDEFLFDYDDLTTMDRQLKRLIPFYSFLRKNAEMEARAMFRNPGRQALQLRAGRNLGQAIFGGEKVSKEDESALPEFFREGLKIAQANKEKDTIEILSGLGLPIEDLEGNPLLVALTGGDIGRAMTRFGGRLGPIVKPGLELLFGQDMFFGSPLEGIKKNEDGTVDYPYTKAYPTLKAMPDFVQDWLEFEEIQRPTGAVYRMNPYKMKQFEFWTLGIFSRLYSTTGKLADTKKTGMSKAVDVLTGVKKYELPGVSNLQERAAKRRVSQVANLLMGESADLKYRQGE
jgi:hypothetical protein